MWPHLFLIGVFSSFIFNIIFNMVGLGLQISYFCWIGNSGLIVFFPFSSLRCSFMFSGLHGLWCVRGNFLFPFLWLLLHFIFSSQVFTTMYLCMIFMYILFWGFFEFIWVFNSCFLPKWLYYFYTVCGLSALVTGSYTNIMKRNTEEVHARILAVAW